MARVASISTPEPVSSPVGAEERYRILDMLRGLALFGVLIVNLVDGFRISLFAKILGLNPESGWNGALNSGIDAFVEFKAMALFSILFGVGTAIQAERKGRPGVFLARRFCVLFAIGLMHVVFIWNGDILMLYAVCGLILIPFLRFGNTVLLVSAFVWFVLPYLVSLPIPWPSHDAMRLQAEAATRVYSTGGFAEILVFRCREFWTFILPLLLSSLPKTVGSMLLGVAAWRAGLFTSPSLHRRFLLCLFVVGMVFGFASVLLTDFGLSVLLGTAYGAGVLLWVTPRRTGIACLGQMALTNYLMQSIVLSFVFYGFGLGLFGKLSTSEALALGIVSYVAQIWLSVYWLRRFSFGPVEWLWRCLSYGRRVPFLRVIGVPSPR